MTILTRFVGVGAQRCGTTWLDLQLRRHPQVYLPEARKEIHFFDEHFDRGVAWYQEFFRGADHQPDVVAAGEITPRYLFAPLAATRIAAVQPDAKILICLRNPADRAYSHFGLELSRGRTSAKDLFQFVDQMPEAFYRGLYSAQVERFLARFPRDRILILLFEDMMRHQADALRRVFRFLDIDEGSWMDANTSIKVNESNRTAAPRARRLATGIGKWLRDRDMDGAVNWAKAVRVERLFGTTKPMPPVDPEQREALMALYEDDIARLEALLDIDLAQWRGSVALGSNA